MKIKKQKLIVALLMFMMIVMYGFVPVQSEATSMEVARDTISDSDVSATGVTHTLYASTTQTVPDGGRVEFVFANEITAISSTTFSCAAGTGNVTVDGSGQTLTCTYTDGVLSTGPHTFTLTGATNPSTVGSYKVDIYTYTGASVQIEHSAVRIAIVNDVVVTATVDATLTFAITGLQSGANVNGVLTTASSTTQTLAFGTLSTTATSTMGQHLSVTTNANYGYSVKVFQDHNLLASNGADIDSFANGTAASTTAIDWVNPTGTLGSENTYGHFGITSGDSTLSAYNFGSKQYKGFDGTDQIEVMYHSGASDGTTDDIGSSTVAYTIGITALQEAGDYSNTLTYICTPTY